MTTQVRMVYYEALDQFNWYAAELTAYSTVIKKQLNYEAKLEQKYDEGKAEVLVAGKIAKAQEIAKKLLKQNMAITTIAELKEQQIIDLY